jgi:hypothetical protein
VADRDGGRRPGVGAALAALVATPLAVVASGGLASRGRGPQFFLLTLLFLGPLGVAAAAVAQPRHWSSDFVRAWDFSRPES